MGILAYEKSRLRELRELRTLALSESDDNIVKTSISTFQTSRMLARCDRS